LLGERVIAYAVDDSESSTA